MILNNTEMYIYTVYSYHNYAIINIILVYSNFFSVYHSSLLLKQWITKLHEKRITANAYALALREYFSLPYDFTSWPKNGDAGLLRPLSGIYCFFSCPAIIYYIYKNIRLVNLHKISRTFLCNIFIVELLTFPAIGI